MENKKIKVLKKIILIICIILAIFVVLTARKLIIIKSLGNKVEKLDSNNYLCI